MNKRKIGCSAAPDVSSEAPNRTPDGGLHYTEERVTKTEYTEHVDLHRTSHRTRHLMSLREDCSKFGDIHKASVLFVVPLDTPLDMVLREIAQHLEKAITHQAYMVQH